MYSILLLLLFLNIEELIIIFQTNIYFSNFNESNIFLRIYSVFLIFLCIILYI